MKIEFRSKGTVVHEVSNVEPRHVMKLLAERKLGMTYDSLTDTVRKFRMIGMVTRPGQGVLDTLTYEEIEGGH